MSDPDPSPLARALGVLPTGLFIVTTRDEERPAGFVASFLTQVGLDPPSVCVAIGKGRGPLELVRKSGRFGVSILDPSSLGCMGAFFKAYEAGEGPFDSLEMGSAPGGSPVLAEALAWLECRVTGEHETQDHVVVFGEVECGELQREGEPATHVRKNGLSY